ncbi:MAG: hypothetical protein C5B49_15140 [Bdellovibrio sp.]|nr:MAG: hypothetical protein C5B49_15140 [Bdellovibrio sp.]
MSYRRRFRRRAGETTFALNITSMTDVFTLLLVFLLQTYASSELQVEPHPGVKLPVSSSLKDPNRVPQLVVSSQEVLLDGKKVLSLNNGRFSSADLDPQNPLIIKPLFAALKTRLEKPADAKEPPPDSVLLQADASRDMTELSLYFATISAAGFPKVKLATVVGR